MQKRVELQAAVDVDCPPNMSEVELCEAGLQAFTAWLTALNGWRARTVKVECGQVGAAYQYGKGGSEGGRLVAVTKGGGAK